MKILVVEDDPTVTQNLNYLFSRYHYAVDVAADGEAGLEMAEAFDYDLVLLDILLPRLDGASLCQKLRSKGLQVPILLLTGQSEGHQKTAKPNVGADGYITKPVDTQELITRVQTLLSRSSPNGQLTLRWGNLIIDLRSRRVTYEAHLVAVTPKEYAILELFLRNCQAVFSASMILDHVWNSAESPGEEAVRVHIKEIRQKLKLAGAPKDLIKTVHRVGYQLNPLYSSFLATQDEQHLTPSQIAELKSVNEELRQRLNHLQDTHAELHAKHHKLAIAHQQLESQQRAEKHQPLQPAQGGLNNNLAESVLTRNGWPKNEPNLLENILDFILAGYWDWDIPNHREYLSPGFKRIFGYEDGELPNAPETWMNLIFPEDLSQVLACFEQHVQSRGQVPYYNEVRYRHKNGSTVWVICSGQVIEWDIQGNPIRMIGCHIDITKRKQAEAALQESEARFRFLADHAPILIWMSDPDKRCSHFNKQWLAFTGREIAEELGEGWIKNVHPDDLKSCWETYVKAFDARQTFEIEYRLRRFDGEYRWILDTGVPRYASDGEFLGYIGSCIDISDRKFAEQKIHEQAALLDIAADAIFVHDLDQHILYWNQGAERLYGWQASEALGHKVTELLPTGRAQTETIMQTLLDQGEWRGELRKTTKIGQAVIVEGRWTLVRNDMGQPKFILSVDTDVTEKKQLEAQFYQAQRLESLGRLASGIAHDLNNVLTPILTITQLMRLTQPDLDETTQERLKLLEDSAKRGAGMVKQVLTFTQGSGEERTPVNLALLLREVVSIALQSFPKSIEICQKFPSAANSPQVLKAVAADPTHLHQVLMNLCINARDAMPQGGTLTLAAENIFVDDGISQLNIDAQVGDYVVITVADTGSGITPEVRDRMFDPFFTTKETGQGTGLGLSTVLGIVKNYGGFLQVESEIGQGTQVKVYLPTIADVPVKSQQPKEQFDGNETLILIVDDDVAVQRTTQALLASHHYKTLVANDGLEAIDRFNHSQAEINLIVLDVMMPNMGGIPLIQRLKRIDPKARIVAISGLPANQEAVLAAGADAFLAKPYSVEILLRTLKRLQKQR